MMSAFAPERRAHERGCRGLVISLWLLAAAAVTVSAQPALDHDQSPTVPVLTYNQVHGMLAEPDPTPLVRIYGDGQVRVHYPAIMQRAGDYELQLTRGELEALLASLAEKGVFTFDGAAVKAQRQQAETQKRLATGTLYERSDQTWTVIEARLEAAPGGKAEPLVKTVAWRDLKWDAARFGSIEALQDLAAAEEELRALLERDDLLEVRQ